MKIVTLEGEVKLKTNKIMGLKSFHPASIMGEISAEIQLVDYN